MPFEIRRCTGGMVLFAMSGNDPNKTTRYMACHSPYQDEKYGKGMRVHTVSGKKEGGPRCTVCGFGNGVVRP